jgi:hypothetical protein
MQTHFVCDGKCIAAKHLREQTAVEIQNRQDSDNQIEISTCLMLIAS